MSAKTPTVKQIAWVSLIPHVIVLALLIWPWYEFTYREEPHMALAYGAISFLLLSKSLRSLIPKSHRAGMIKVKSQDFEGAIIDFQKGYDFFHRQQWLDKYRFLLVLTSTAVSYKEMALLNIAFCHGQIGDGKTSKEFYKKVLAEFPESGMAIAAIKQINSIEESTE